MARIFVRRVITGGTLSARGARVYPSAVSTRFRLRDIPGERPLVEKRGDPGAIAREVAALLFLEGRPWVPALVDHGPGWMVSARLPGAPRRIAGAGAPDARRLGALLREVHETRRGAEGGLWWWDAPAASLDDYRRGRAEDAERMLAGGPDAGLARRAMALAPGGGSAPGAFRHLHGDLVEANVVWGPAGPALVDWEFARMGDPAEDLAYLIEANALPQEVAAGVLEGYALAGMDARLAGWRALMAADAGAWYLAEGIEDEGRRLLARAHALVGAHG